MLDEEKWKPAIANYMVSSEGRVMNATTGRVLKQELTQFGYLKVSIGNPKKSRFVHRLVAIAFIGDPNAKDINHKDGVKTNNNVSNLEIVSRSENMKHAHVIGLTNISSICRPVNRFSLSGELIDSYKSTADAGRAIGKSNTHIVKACKRHSPAYGYLWEYAGPPCWAGRRYRSRNDGLAGTPGDRYE